MGIKNTIKQKIMHRVMKKRKNNTPFDEIASELYELPEDAANDMNNSYYFSAHNMDGTAIFFRFGKRSGGKNAMAEVWFALRLPDGTAYVNSQRLLKLSESTAHVKCITPLKEWEFSFSGKMYPVKPDGNLIAQPCGSEFDAKFTGIFTSNSALYEFSRDSEIKPFCRAIAAEKWAKGFADQLKHAHQIHIEQDGFIKGVFNIGEKIHKIDAPAIRDHSFGRRVWSYMNCHKWLIAILEDGSTLNANSVRYPALNVEGLKTGYKMFGKKIINVIDWIFSGDKKNSKYTVTYSDKTTDECAFSLDIMFEFEFTDEHGSYTIYEGLSAFTINGKKGRGITEFGYNGDSLRYK